MDTCLACVNGRGARIVGLGGWEFVRKTSSLPPSMDGARADVFCVQSKGHSAIPDVANTTRRA